MVEGTPLLRVQAGNRLEGSNPFHSAIILSRTWTGAYRGAEIVVFSKGFASPMRTSETTRQARFGL